MLRKPVIGAILLYKRAISPLLPRRAASTRPAPSMLCRRCGGMVL